MPKKRRRCTDASLFCDVCLFLDSIGGIDNDGVSRKIRCSAKKNGHNTECMGHRIVFSPVSCETWDYTVWTCDSAYSGTTWDGKRTVKFYNVIAMAKRHRHVYVYFINDFMHETKLILPAGSHSKWGELCGCKSHGGTKDKTYRSVAKTCHKAGTKNWFWMQFYNQWAQVTILQANSARKETAT